MSPEDRATLAPRAEPKLARRAFLSLLGSVPGLVLTGPAWAAARASRPGPRARRSRGLPGQDDFRALLGESVDLRTPDGRRGMLEAVEVREYPVGESWPFAHRPFSVLFRGPSATAMGQDVYRVAHPSIGAHDLLLVPVVSDPGTALYEAVFA